MSEARLEQLTTSEGNIAVPAQLRPISETPTHEAEPRPTARQKLVKAWNERGYLLETNGSNPMLNQPFAEIASECLYEHVQTVSEEIHPGEQPPVVPHEMTTKSLERYYKRFGNLTSIGTSARTDRVIANMRYNYLKPHIARAKQYIHKFPEIHIAIDIQRELEKEGYRAAAAGLRELIAAYGDSIGQLNMGGGTVLKHETSPQTETSD